METSAIDGDTEDWNKSSKILLYAFNELTKWYFYNSEWTADFSLKLLFKFSFWIGC